MKARLYSSQIVSIGAPSAHTHNQSIQFLDQLAAAALPDSSHKGPYIIYIENRRSEHSISRKGRCTVEI
jgi:hypothetical protein